MATLDFDIDSFLLPTMTDNEKEKVRAYLQQMDDKQIIALHIGRDHLKTSFDLLKTIGFNDWLKKSGSTT